MKNQAHEDKLATIALLAGIAFVMWFVFDPNASILLHKLIFGY